MIEQGRPPFILNCLCTSLAILAMHMNEAWPELVEDLTREFANSVAQATCLLMILKYMASDCDNDSIVIEDSIRSNYFLFMDAIAG